MGRDPAAGLTILGDSPVLRRDGVASHHRPHPQRNLPLGLWAHLGHRPREYYWLGRVTADRADWVLHCPARRQADRGHPARTPDDRGDGVLHLPPWGDLPLHRPGDPDGAVRPLHDGRRVRADGAEAVRRGDGNRDGPPGDLLLVGRDALGGEHRRVHHPVQSEPGGGVGVLPGERLHV